MTINAKERATPFLLMIENVISRAGEQPLEMMYNKCETVSHLRPVSSEIKLVRNAITLFALTGKAVIILYIPQKSSWTKWFERLSSAALRFLAEIRHGEVVDGNFGSER